MTSVASVVFVTLIIHDIAVLFVETFITVAADLRG